MANLKTKPNLSVTGETRVKDDDKIVGYCNILNIDTGEKRVIGFTDEGVITLPENWVNVTVSCDSQSTVLKQTRRSKQPDKNKKWYQRFDRKREY